MARGIIIVHGIGEQKRGDFLQDVVASLANYLESKGAKVDFQLHSELVESTEIPLGRSKGSTPPTQVALKIHGPGGDLSEEWRVREAYWASSFRPPTLRQMLQWGSALVSKESRAVSRIFDNPLNENPDDACGPQRRKSRSRVGTTLDTPTIPTPSRDYPRRVERFYRNQAFVYKVALWLTQRAGQGLLAMVWLLLMLAGALRSMRPDSASGQRLSLIGQPVSWLIKGVNALANYISPFVVYGLGDAKVFLDNPVAADAIRSSFEDAFLEMLEEEDIQSITIIAHSLGAVVSYDAMTEGRPIDLYLRKHPEKRNMPNSNDPRRITWVTVGAALNRSYTITQKEAASRPSERFRSPVAAAIRSSEQAFFWLNLYSRYDPVPAGPIEPEFHRYTKVECTQFKERMVINNDSPFSDHTAYWKNDVLVWPRIIRAICDGSYPWARTSLAESENQELIRRRTIGIADRNRRLLQLLGLPLLFGVMAVTVLGLAGLLLYLLWRTYQLASRLAFVIVDGLITVLRRLFVR